MASHFQDDTVGEGSENVAKNSLEDSRCQSVGMYQDYWVSFRGVERSSKIRISIYKFEFGFELFPIQFVTAVSDVLSPLSPRSCGSGGDCD